jgi:hypothetical protein
MLTPAALERAPTAYRLGYRDGYWDTPEAPPQDAGWLARPFLNGDYADGYEAGLNDAKWDRHNMSQSHA